MPKNILIVDDDPLIRSFLATVLGEEGYRIEEARNGKEGLARLSGTDFDLVVTDLRMPDQSGIELMQEGRKTNPGVRWIVITAFGTIETAVEAMKLGASDYLTKPLKDPEELRRVVRRVIREAESETRIALLTEELGERFPPVEKIFLGEKMGKVQSLVRDVAPTAAHGAPGRPERDGKGTRRPRDPQHESPPGKAVRCRPLRGAFRGADGERTFRA
jgi:DNA-binding NtrC family response regulator